jgi:hypothetical protein
LGFHDLQYFRSSQPLSFPRGEGVGERFFINLTMPDRALFEMAVRALAEGNALRATARIVQVEKATVCAWLDRVARHCRTVMLSLWHNVHVQECPLDE